MNPSRVPERVDGLPEVEKTLSASKLEAWVGALSEDDVAVALPRFEVSSAAPLRIGGELKALGMELASDRQRADFTGMAAPLDASERLSIDRSPSVGSKLPRLPADAAYPRPPDRSFRATQI